MFSICSMSRNPEKQARAEQILGELAELGLMLAREMAVQARQAENPMEQAALATAFQKTARTVRLTLALDARLERQAARDARADARADAREAQAADAAQAVRRADARPQHDPGPVELQKRRVRSLSDRLLWNEAEGDSEEYELLGDDLDARLEEVAQAPGFADLPPEAVAQRLAADMRLTGERVGATPAAFTPTEPEPPPPADTG
jgi:hypothetical protein